jgi:hypothetical protein
MSFTPDSSTQTPSHVIKTELVTQNAHNICTHKPLNINSPTVWRNPQANGAFVSIKIKLI